MLSADLEKLQSALASSPRTTAQLAIACKWTVEAAFANMVALEREGRVARESARPVNSAAVKWRLASADALTAAIERATEEERALPTQPGAPGAAAWAAADAPKSVPRTTKRAVPISEDINPYEAPAQVPEPSHPTTPFEEVAQRQAEGSFWLGFVAGVTFGLIAFIATRNSAPETHRGTSWGVAAQLVFFIFWSIVEA